MKRITVIICIIFFSLMAKRSTEAQVAVNLSVNITDAPPAMPEYDQPPCPVDGYLWTPGYWSYGTEGYYWVPGVWLYPAQPGYLWTPGYWDYEDGYYRWHRGYWGPHVGFYGGVYYGHGYYGVGYYGGRWEGRHFRYNTAVCNVNTTVIHNTYVDRTVINNGAVNRSSFRGGRGINSQPSASERSAMKENHVGHTREQNAHLQAASHDKNRLASVNKGRSGAGNPGNTRTQHNTPANSAPENHGSRPSSSRPPQHINTRQPAEHHSEQAVQPMQHHEQTEQHHQQRMNVTNNSNQRRPPQTRQPQQQNRPPQGNGMQGGGSHGGSRR